MRCNKMLKLGISMLLKMGKFCKHLVFDTVLCYSILSKNTVAIGKYLQSQTNTENNNTLKK